MDGNWKEHYSLLAEFLGRALGPDYEIVLHDLTGGGHSIAALVNAHVSGRGADAALSNLALDFIFQKRYEGSDYLLNYSGVSADGRQLRSSTFFIKEKNGGLAGMLCINFNQGKYRDFADGILGFLQENYGLSASSPQDSELNLIENFSQSVAQRLRTTLYRMFGGDCRVEDLTQEQKIAVVRELYGCGVFQVKGAIPEVAGLLHSSIPSIYRYLSAVRARSHPCSKEDQ